MRPIVSLYRLGRLRYTEALNIQQILFENLKKNVTQSIDHLPATIDHSIKDNNNRYQQQQQKFTHQEANNYETLLSSSTPLNKSFESNVRRNSLLLVEHDPVYTIGVRFNEYDDGYVTRLKKELAEHRLDADFIKTNRGGLITFHGPGQLVAYPIIYLGDFPRIHNKSVKAYVNLLESTVIDTLTSVGLKGAHTVKEYPGVWLDNGERKIAFIGISCKRYVTMHGISINCDCDLSWFNHIVSCGIEDKLITSIKNESLASLATIQTSSKVGQPILKSDQKDFRCLDYSTDRISEAFCQSFEQNFNCILDDDEAK